jgi:DNA-binding HxlR family transcriptional regulator
MADAGRCATRTCRPTLTIRWVPWWALDDGEGHGGVTKGQDGSWTFLTNHSHVLICLTRDPEQRVRDIAEQVGITERAVQKILGELEGEGYIVRTRVGRRNRYDLHPDRPMRHWVERGHTVAELLDVMGRPVEATTDER